MTKELWINLPVKDVKRSTDFFTKIGFTLNTRFPATEHSASLLVGTKNIVVMLFAESIFQGFVNNPISNLNQGSEVLFSFDAESKEEVDELAEKVKSAGGTIYAGPGESQGWMYSFGFIDPDRHRWNVLYMDMSKMPGM